MKFSGTDLICWMLAICACVLIGTCTYKEAMKDINSVNQEQKP